MSHRMAPKVTANVQLPGLHYPTHAKPGTVQDIRVHVYMDPHADPPAYILTINHAGMTLDIQTTREGVVMLRDMCNEALDV